MARPLHWIKHQPAVHALCRDCGMRHLFGPAAAAATILNEIETPRLHGGIYASFSSFEPLHIADTIVVSRRLFQADWLVERLECLSRDFEPPAMDKGLDKQAMPALIS